MCHIVATTEGGSWVFEQLRGLRDRHGMEVSAIVSGDSGRLVDQLRSEAIPFLAWDFGMQYGDLRALRSRILGLARLLRRERFDVVQTHVFPTMMVGRIAAWLADVPLRLAMIAGPFHLQAQASRAIDRDTCFMDHVLIASCELTRRIYRDLAVPERRLALVYYGPDPRRFDPETTTGAGLRAEFGWPADTPIVGMVAYFYPRLKSVPWVPPELWERGVKGHEDLVQRPETKFLFVGRGFTEGGEEYQRDVAELVRSLGLSSSVVFAGHRTDVASVLRDLDVSVQASLNENLGGTLESLFMARPTVATRVGGMVDSVRDGETGILVRPSDPADLARGILDLLRDPDRARELGRAGRRLMLERFTLERTVDDLAALYNRELRQRARGFRYTRSALRAAAAVPLASYLAFRLRSPEHKALGVWDRLRFPRGC